jgi:hypothetical protein
MAGFFLKVHAFLPDSSLQEDCLCRFRTIPSKSEELAFSSLDGEQWTAFVTELDAPPRELPRLKLLFQEKSIFEQA